MRSSLPVISKEYYSHLLFLFYIVVISGCTGDEALRKDASAVLRQEQGVAVYAAGDIADCRHTSPEGSGAARTAALLESRLSSDREAVVLTLGDHTYPKGLLAEFTDCYEATWGRFKVRTYPVPGNHEYYSPQAKGYYSYFGERAGPAGRGYYSFRLGSWHVVALNSTLQPAEHTEQLEWLKHDLQQHPTQCILAFWHHPLFSSGGHGNNPRMRDAWQILQRAGAEIVLTSHDHNYERFAPQDSSGRRDDFLGIRQFVVGTGGAKLTPMLFWKWNSQRSDNSSHGVLKVVLKTTGYEWEFLPVDEGGFTDRGAGLCH